MPLAAPSGGTVPSAMSPAATTNPDDVLAVEIKADGKVGYQGSIITLAQLKLRLKEVARVTPAQVLVLQPDAKATRKQIDRVLAVCQALHLRNSSVAGATSPPPPAPSPLPADVPAANSTGNLPSPRFLMRADSMPTNAPTSPPAPSQELANPSTPQPGGP
jgi:hypothetical protein